MGLQLKKKEIQRVFKKLEIETVSNKHHVRGFIELDGKKVIPIYYSHGRGEIPGRIPEKIRNSLCLEDDEFRLLVKCPLKKEEYFAILRNRLVR